MCKRNSKTVEFPHAVVFVPGTEISVGGKQCTEQGGGIGHMCVEKEAKPPCVASNGNGGNNNAW